MNPLSRSIAATPPATPEQPLAAADADAAYRARATAAAEKFEGFFIAQMLKEMRASASEFSAEGSVFKDPVNADMMSLADGLVADQIAGQHAFGVADAILRQLLPQASAAAPGAGPLNVPPPAVASDKG